MQPTDLQLTQFWDTILRWKKDYGLCLSLSCFQDMEARAAPIPDNAPVIKLMRGVVLVIIL
jgi:hypothetical protein